MTGQTDVRGKRDLLFLLPLLLFLMLMGARASQASEACLQRRAVKRVVKLTDERGCAGALAKVRGYHEAGDRGGGRFAWKPAGAFASSDGGTVFAARGGGWWVRQRRREDVANVRWFGARGDGADVPRKNARAFNEAIASLEDGGVVEVPGPATYIVGGSRSRIMMAEGITLRGTGGERVAELKGPKRGASRMIYISEDVQGTAVENLKMDLRSRKDYGTALFKKGGGCVVRGNIFYDSTLYLEESDPAYTGDENWTRMAILNRGSELQVQDNIFRGVQAKVAGGKGRMTGIDVTNNEFYDSQAHAISLVTSADRAVIEDTRIRDNYLYNFVRNGIYIGSDKGQSEGAQVRFNDVDVSGNHIVIGPQLQEFKSAIVVRALGKGRDVRIHQNVIECFEDAAPPHGGGNLKMIVVRSGRPGVVLQGLSITGNEMRADRRVNHAIRVREYATEDLLVAENDIASSGRGIELQSRNGGAEIRGNEVSVGSYALRVAGSRNLGIVENTFTHTGRGEGATSVRLAGRVSGTIRDNRIRSTSGVPLKAAFGTDEGGSFDLSISGNEVTGAVKRIHF